MFGIKWPLRCQGNAGCMCPEQGQNLQKQPMVFKPVAIILTISGSTMKVRQHLDEAAEGSFAAEHCRTKQPKDPRFNERLAVLPWPTYYLLPTTYYTTTYYLLPTTYYQLPTTYYLLRTTNY